MLKRVIYRDAFRPCSRDLSGNLEQWHKSRYFSKTNPCVCGMCSTRLLFWDGSLLFQNRRDILNTTLL